MNDQKILNEYIKQEPTGEYQEDISIAQEIIENLVTDAEQSFIYTERDSYSIFEQTQIFDDRKKYPFKQSLKSLTTNDEQSFSFESNRYLKKYGL